LNSKLIIGIAAVVFISSLFGVFPYINFLISSNSGLPQIRGLNTLTIYVPAAFLTIHALTKKTFQAPYIAFLVVTVLGFLLLELINSASYRVPFDPDYAARLIRLYLYFLVLLMVINVLGYELTLKWAIFFGLCLCVLVLGSYSGLYAGHHADYDIFQSESFVRAGKLGSSMNVNLLSYKAAITMVLIFAYYYHYGKLFKWPIILYGSLMLLIAEIVIHASRGAFLTVMVLAVVTLVYRKRYMELLFGGLGLIGLGLFFFEELLNIVMATQLYDRLNEELGSVSRLVQMKANLINFGKNPFTGVGYHNAARGLSVHLTRSNFTWTQILASHGIFYFLLYLVFMFRLFLHNTGQMKYALSAVVGSFILINLSSQRPFEHLALLAMLTYFDSQFRNEEDPVS